MATVFVGSGSKTPREKQPVAQPRPKPAHLLPRPKPAHLQKASSSSPSAATSESGPTAADLDGVNKSLSKSGAAGGNDEPWGNTGEVKAKSWADEMDEEEMQSVAESTATAETWGHVSNGPW